MLDRTTSIDNILQQLRVEADQLPSLVDMLSEEPPEVRDVWHWRWQGLMESLDALCRQHRAGLMNVTQEREFLAVSRLLAEVRVPLETLGCRIPQDIDSSIDARG